MAFDLKEKPTRSRGERFWVRRKGGRGLDEVQSCASRPQVNRVLKKSRIENAADDAAVKLKRAERAQEKRAKFEEAVKARELKLARPMTEVELENLEKEQNIKHALQERKRKRLEALSKKHVALKATRAKVVPIRKADGRSVALQNGVVVEEAQAA